MCAGVVLQVDGAAGQGVLWSGGNASEQPKRGNGDWGEAGVVEARLPAKKWQTPEQAAIVLPPLELFRLALCCVVLWCVVRWQPMLAKTQAQAQASASKHSTAQRQHSTAQWARSDPHCKIAQSPCFKRARNLRRVTGAGPSQAGREAKRSVLYPDSRSSSCSSAGWAILDWAQGTKRGPCSWQSGFDSQLRPAVGSARSGRRGRASH